MALHATLMVNSFPIGLIYAQRRETIDMYDPNVGDSVNTYDCRIEYANGREAPWEGVVRHRYADGGWDLVEAILRARHDE